jgi:hypothetical protein
MERMLYAPPPSRGHGDEVPIEQFTAFMRLRTRLVRLWSVFDLTRSFHDAERFFAMA